MQDGEERVCDILAVADGANSKLRAALHPQETLRYCGVVMVTVMHLLPSSCFKHLFVPAYWLHNLPELLPQLLDRCMLIYQV